MKQIQKHARNKTLLVYIVCVVCSKNSGQKTVATQIEEENYYQENTDNCNLTQC